MTVFFCFEGGGEGRRQAHNRQVEKRVYFVFFAFKYHIYFFIITLYVYARPTEFQLGGSHFLCFLCLRHNGASHSIDDVASKHEKKNFFRVEFVFFVVISQNN